MKRFVKIKYEVYMETLKLLERLSEDAQVIARDYATREKAWELLKDECIRRGEIIADVQEIVTELLCDITGKAATAYKAMGEIPLLLAELKVLGHGQATRVREYAREKCKDS